MSAATIRLDASERWLRPGSPLGRASRPMALLALASLSGHLLLVGVAVMSGRQPPPPPPEISVEVVQEVPKPAVEPQKRAEAEAPKPAVEPKPEPVKPEPVKPEPPRPEPPKAEQTKPEPPKPQPPPKSQPAPKPRPAPQTAAAPQPEPRVAAEEQKLAALQKELESLRAEQASLQADHAAAEAAQAPAALRDTGLGPLPSSFQAVALPAAVDGAGDATSYQEIVFSALAKAKGIGRTKGLPGSAGVRFSVDAAGRLVDVELVQRSGVPSLDAEALAIVRRAAPFPPPPQGAQRSFFANVNFVTEGGR